jgi:DNA-binding LacI/PurR family transcriptional regulator
MTSIKDIARATNFSYSTVSRALRNSPLVNEETAGLIRKAADERGYTLSAVARSLVTKRTDTIGVVVTNIADPFVGEVVSGIEVVAQARGYSVLLACCHADPEREMRAVRLLHERRVDGILVNSSRVGALYMGLLAKLKAPIVLINNQHPGEFIYSVTIDNRSAAQDATRHLLELGHRRIGYIGNQFGLQADTDRFAGYRQVLEATESRKVGCAAWSDSWLCLSGRPPFFATTIWKRLALCVWRGNTVCASLPTFRLLAWTTCSSHPSRTRR